MKKYLIFIINYSLGLLARVKHKDVYSDINGGIRAAHDIKEGESFEMSLNDHSKIMAQKKEYLVDGRKITLYQ